jgi:hypothetical protein
VYSRLCRVVSSRATQSAENVNRACAYSTIISRSRCRGKEVENVTNQPVAIGRKAKH